MIWFRLSFRSALLGMTIATVLIWIAYVLVARHVTNQILVVINEAPEGLFVKERFGGITLYEYPEIDRAILDTWYLRSNKTLLCALAKNLENPHSKVLPKELVEARTVYAIGCVGEHLDRSNVLDVLKRLNLLKDRTNDEMVRNECALATTRITGQ